MDINCDLGEGTGNEAAILPFLHSANIACGFHAGSALEMAETVQLAKKHGVRVGAHPSWNDKTHFGRKEQQLTSNETHALLLYQLGALDAICRANQWPMTHVKPHGALYNQASADPTLATLIAQTIYQFNPDLELYALHKSQLALAGKQANLVVKEEAFADRRYLPNGQLAPRSEPNAVITQTDDMLQQARLLIHHHQVNAINGATLHIKAHTICIHGDGVNAVPFARALHGLLQSTTTTHE